MLIPFIKMQAQGNDFVILNGFESPVPSLAMCHLAEKLCSRHFGVGADGLVILEPGEGADAQMTIYNSDGSRAAMCGSALRCVSILTSQATGRKSLTINTDSGLKRATCDPETQHVSVNLGTPRILTETMCVAGFCGDLVDVGNLHYVVYRDHLDDDPHLKHGSMLEHHKDFPTTVNVHFVRRMAAQEIQMKIWENACGATLACGTGAVASVCSGIRQGLLSSPVVVNMPGGRVEIEVLEGTGAYLLSGIVDIVFSGVYKWKI